MYYGHFFNYSRAVNGDHCLIWSRPVDAYPVLQSLNISAFLRFSPPYVMASGWVGDQDPTFAGLQAALINIFESAWQVRAVSRGRLTNTCSTVIDSGESGLARIVVALP